MGPADIFFPTGISPTIVGSALIGLLVGMGLLNLGARHTWQFGQTLQRFLRDDRGKLQVKYAQSVLFRRRWVKFLPLSPWLLSCLAGLVLIEPAWHLAGFIGGNLLAMVIVSRQRNGEPFASALDQASGEAAKAAALELSRHGEVEDVAGLMALAARHVDPYVRAGAAWGLAGLPDSDNDLLQSLTFDQHPFTAVAAQTALANQKSLPEGNAPASVFMLGEALRMHKAAIGGLSDVANPAPGLLFDLRTSEAALDVVAHSHAFLQYETAYCLRCLCRPVRRVYRRWQWMCCPLCGEANALVDGVAHVVGVIGQEEPMYVQNGELRLSLWSEELRLARTGPIDWLEVMGGMGINYDWAVAAVVQKFRDFTHRQQLFPIRLCDAPVLEENSLMLLQSLSPYVELRDGA